MRLSTAITFALTVLLVTSTVGVVAATPSASPPAPEPAPTVDPSPLESRSPSLTQASDPTPPSVLSALSTTQDSDEPPAAADPRQVIRINIDENGDAHWTIESRFVLTSDEEEADFYEYADAVAAGERGIVFDRQLFEYQANEASDRTDREMSIENAGWDEPRVEPVPDDETTDGDETNGEETRIGVITYSFIWTDFATVENDRIYFGDAFHTDDGVWLSLTDGQRLIIEKPSNYALETPTELEWTGPYQFEEDELEIVFVRSGGGSGFDLGASGWLIGAAALLLFIVGAGGYLLARRTPKVDLPPPIDRVPERVATSGIAARVSRLRSRLRARLGREQQRPSAATDTDGGTVQSAPETAGDVGGTDRRAGAPGTHLEFEEEADDGIDPELLSDEERVLRMLTRNGGRMKQASIVTETGWSNAKVSQLLSQMDEDDEIEKLRIGRENLITLPDVDPTELD